MKCIVTAGPTFEELDQVRRLTNFSTGALGTELANHLAGCGHQVVLLRGHYSTSPVEPQTLTEVFTTSADLRQRLKILRRIKPVAIFHAAAVSDFTFGKIWVRDAKGKLKPILSPKIPTRNSPLLAELVPAPKIISQLRRWFPSARLVGWKYELEGNRAKAIALAAQQLADNSTDACVVNGSAYGPGFGLVTAPDKCRHLRDKEALFNALELGMLAKIAV